MALNIRGDEAQRLARALADHDQTSMTDAVITALKESLAARKRAVPLRQRGAAIAAELKALAQPGGREPSQQEIDAMWGLDAD